MDTILGLVGVGLALLVLLLMYLYQRPRMVDPSRCPANPKHECELCEGMKCYSSYPHCRNCFEPMHD